MKTQIRLRGYYFISHPPKNPVLNGMQSRTQSPQALWPAVGRKERLLTTNRWPKSMRTLGARLDGMLLHYPTVCSYSFVQLAPSCELAAIFNWGKHCANDGVC